MRSRRGTRKGGPRTTIVALALALVLALGGLAVASSAPRGPVVHTVALDAHPCELTLDPTGRYAFLSTYTSDPQTQTNTPARTVVFDLRTGARVRAVDVGTAPQAMAVDPGRGRLIVAGNGALALIDMRTGRVTTMTSASSIFDPIIVDDRRGRFYGIDNGAGGFRGNLDIFDARTGALLKQATLRASQDLDGTLNAGGVAADLRAGRIYVPYTTSVYGTTAMTDSVAVLDPSGRLLHTATIGHFSAQGGSALAAAVDPLHDRVVVVDNDTGDVSTLDARTGGIVRTLHLATVTAMRANMPARAFGSSALDARTGRVFLALPRRELCAFPRPSTGGSYGRCVPTGPPGRLYMLDTRSGRVLRRLAAGIDPGQITLDEKAGVVLAQNYASPTATGELRIFDAATGAPRWRIPLGPQISGRYSFLDDATGRVYLVDQGGTVSLLDMHTGRVSTGETVAALGQAAPGPGYVNVTITNGRVVAVRDNGADASPPDPLGWLPSQVRRLLPWRPPRPRAIPGSVTIFDAPQ